MISELPDQPTSADISLAVAKLNQYEKAALIGGITAEHPELVTAELRKLAQWQRDQPGEYQQLCGGEPETCPCGQGPDGNCPGAWHGCDWHDDGPDERGVSEYHAEEFALDRGEA